MCQIVKKQIAKCRQHPVTELITLLLTRVPVDCCHAGFTSSKRKLDGVEIETAPQNLSLN